MPFWKTYHGRLKFILLFILLIQVYNAIQSRQEKVTNFGCEICADKSGYYIYLPIWFNYGLDQKDMPELAKQRTSQNFENELAPGKSFTKFTSGEALMLTPFYLAGDLWFSRFGDKAPIPISHHYLKFTNFGTAFYIVLAMLALFSLLRKRFGEGVALLTLLLLYFGTNLRYYTEDESLMSHIYSFCQFSFAWYFLEKALDTRKTKHLLFFALCSSWAILIRPTNVLGILMILVLSLRKEEIKDQLRFLSKHLVPMIMAAVVIWIPQLLYWKMTTGQWLIYSYQNEGFHRWKAPALIEQWFAVQSGILPYTPAFLAIPIGMVLMFKRNRKTAAILGVSFVFLSYLFASWWAKGFGDCNFGYRPFVEFSALWSPALAVFIASLFKMKSWAKVSVSIVLLACVWYSTDLYHHFDSCFFGKAWDYSKFIQDYFS
ncbi:MAG: hypothetical protein GC180_01220 [Bacteroidetes bacterium]|nr:hypothetical protein [Bacteroidota bacterium]